MAPSDRASENISDVLARLSPKLFWTGIRKIVAPLSKKLLFNATMALTSASSRHP
jgi:hypothetical protein